MAKSSAPPNSKAFTSSYDPVYSTGNSRRPLFRKQNEPQISSFPQDRTVILRPERHAEFESFSKTIKPWLDVMGMRIKRMDIAYDGAKQVTVVILRTRKQAAIFKLAWG